MVFNRSRVIAFMRALFWLLTVAPCNVQGNKEYPAVSSPTTVFSANRIRHQQGVARTRWSRFWAAYCATRQFLRQGVELPQWACWRVVGTSIFVVLLLIGMGVFLL